jgi:apolipoprotein D and lipocalin family protein
MRAIMKAALVLVALAGTIVTGAASNPRLRVVSGLDLNRYAGKWYEFARFPNQFQDQCARNVIVQYSIRTDGRVDILNQCRKADGTIDQARGVARKAGNGRNSAILEVRFAPAIVSFLPMVWGDYWIIGLGPDYSWAVVGVPSRDYLWILSRTSGMSNRAYREAMEIASGNGFDVSRIVRTAHQD